MQQINIVSSYTAFGSQCTLILSSNVCKKLNISLYNFKSIKEFKNFFCII